MRSLETLRKTPRIFYQPLDHIGSVEGLIELCEDIVKPDFTMVEVGSFSGVSSDVFARYVKTLYCVDLWELNDPENETFKKCERLFDKVLQAHKNIVKIKNYSLEAVKDFPDESLDIVYIDGDHEYPNCQHDIEAWLPKVKKGGWVTGHDTHLDTVLVALHRTIGKDYRNYSDTSWAWQKV